jgi:hypothetical protein
MQDGGLDKCDDFRGGAEDEAGIILEKVTGDGPDTIFLLGEGREDVREIGDIVRRARKAVEFLS